MAGMTIKDIAKKCGVGVSTVSRAMNNHPDINQETKGITIICKLYPIIPIESRV